MITQQSLGIQFGTGVDDAPLLQQVLNHSVAEGNVKVELSGKINLDSKVVLPVGVVVQGEGVGNTIISFRTHNAKLSLEGGGTGDMALGGRLSDVSLAGQGAGHVCLETLGARDYTFRDLVMDEMDIHCTGSDNSSNRTQNSSAFVNWQTIRLRRCGKFHLDRNDTWVNRHDFSDIDFQSCVHPFIIEGSSTNSMRGITTQGCTFPILYKVAEDGRGSNNNYLELVAEGIQNEHVRYEPRCGRNILLGNVWEDKVIDNGFNNKVISGRFIRGIESK